MISKQNTKRTWIVTGIFLPVIVVFCLAGCKEDDKKEFDRQALLTNMAGNVIKPAYQTLGTSIGTLQSAVNAFNAAPDLAALNTLRSAFQTAYLDYQTCSMYNFGPAMDYGIKGAFNTFPTDTTKIETNINTGSYTLGSAGNITAVGFPALDYLLYFGTEAEIISDFTTHSSANNRQAYLLGLVNKMKSEIDAVNNQWTNSYTSTFIAADGNDVASSCSYVLNEFVQDIELLKNAKIGIPSGQQTGGATLPNYVEGYYSGMSKALALENLQGLLTCFTGGSGIGLDDYILDVESDDVTTSLATNITNQFAVCQTKLNALNNPFSMSVASQPAAFNEAYLELKKLIVYTKTDMTSLLGILITYQDNDGD